MRHNWFGMNPLPQSKRPQEKKRRGPVEMWFDRHNHKMEFMRTLFGLIAAGTGILVFLKVFGFIGGL